MRKIVVSSTLVVCFDGQFWVGIAEHVEDGKLSACRILFGAEPSNEEVLAFVLEHWPNLQFSEPVACSPVKMAGNPKRRQREAARELRQRGCSTKAQEALAGQRETLARARKSAARESKRDEARARYACKAQRKKEKKRGR